MIIWRCLYNRNMEQPTLTEFIKILQGYADESPKTGRHAELCDRLSFWIEDSEGNIQSLKIKDIDATRVFGCGCWTGASITFEVDKDV